MYVFNVRRFCRASLRLICISTAAEADSCQGFGLHGDEYNRVTGGPGATKKFQRGKNAVKRKERERETENRRHRHRQSTAVSVLQTTAVVPQDVVIKRYTVLQY